ncbi:MFS transporter [Caldibacillus thermoamylovorans]|jgi:MFS transporter, ACDE family, multidrug resistance protein|uniref:MFS transporter n=1 Tax=Caldibacillus thermoamylovorans TaxID=35841 RepID=UPI0025595DC8|nr:MFS transporter [Caldibacillus thermoamylovorans]
MEYTGTLWEKYVSEEERKKKKKEKKLEDKRWAVVSIASIPLVMTLGNSMLIPVLPTMEKELDITPFQSSLIITVYSVVAIIFIPIAGYLSDRWGRKRVIIPSLLLAAIGGVISAFTAWQLQNAYWLILIGRTLQGIGAAGAFPIVLPLIGDMFHSEDKVSSSLGIIETANTLGKVVSPILGAVFASVIWFLPFFSIPVFCTISVLMMVFLVKSPKIEEGPKLNEFLRRTKKIYKHNRRWLKSIFFIGGILMFILFGVLFYLSSVLESKYGIGNIKKGFFLAIPLGALCIASYIAGKAIKENKSLMKWVTFIGLVLLAISTVVLSFFESLWLLIGLFVIGGIGIGISLPCLDSLITSGIEEEFRGTISSIYSSMRFIGVAFGPPIIAILMKKSNILIFYLLGGLAVLCVLVCIFGIKPEKHAVR